MNIFISGGAKNGKSMFAQHKAKEQAGGGKKLYYVATMDPVDDEDRKRISRHIDDRAGWGFETVEQARNICEIFERGEGSCNDHKQAVDKSGSFLLDSVTALLSNEMFLKDGSINQDAYLKVAEDLVSFAKATGNTVFVSDYIYSDARRFDEFTENYRKGLAYIDRRLAEVCDAVVEVAYGNIIVHKGNI